MKRRLTLRDETGRAILNCYACKTEGRMICDHFACKQRLIDRLADFEDAESREGKSVEVKDGKDEQRLAASAERQGTYNRHSASTIGGERRYVNNMMWRLKKSRGAIS